MLCRDGFPAEYSPKELSEPKDFRGNIGTEVSPESAMPTQ